MAFLAIGDNATGGQLRHRRQGTMDFTGGSVDAMVDLMFLGIDKNGNTSTSTLNSGVLTFTAGKFQHQFTDLQARRNPPLLPIMKPASAPSTSVAPRRALTVNNSLELGHTTIAAPTGTGPASTLGALNITNGAAYVNNIIVGNLSTNNSHRGQRRHADRFQHAGDQRQRSGQLLRSPVPPWA